MQQSESIAPIYAKDGVNLEDGDEFSEFCGAVCRETWENSPLVSIRDFSRGNFRGARTFRLKSHVSPECDFSGDPDGNGTRVILDAVADRPESSASTLVEMTGMDGVRYGGRNAVMLNQLDVSMLGKKGESTQTYFRRCVLGLSAIAKKQGFILLKGETAEMGPCIGSENQTSAIKYIWSGVMISVFHPNNSITGTVRDGQIAVVVREDSLRGNGGSTVRGTFREWYGNNWYDVPAARADIAAAAAPCTPYEDFLQDVNGWNNLDNGVPVPKIRASAIAHITGKGVPGKFFEDYLKPQGFSCELDETFEPPQIIQRIVKYRGITGKQPYNIFHCGQGVVAVLDEADVPAFCDLATKAGREAKPAGRITKAEGMPTLTIKSQFDGEKYTWI